MCLASPKLSKRYSLAASRQARIIESYPGEAHGGALPRSMHLPGQDTKVDGDSGNSFPAGTNCLPFFISFFKTHTHNNEPRTLKSFPGPTVSYMYRSLLLSF